MIPNLKSKRGVILIAVYLVIAVLLAFSVVFINRTINEKNLALRQKNIVLAFHLAEAGLDRGLVWLRGQDTPPGGTAAFDPFVGGEQPLDGGTYSISIDPDDLNPSNPLKRFRITSTSRVADITKSLVNEVQTDTFASYSWFTESERFRRGGVPMTLALWFMAGDRMEGPVRTNSNFYIKNNPVFVGPVQTSEDSIIFFNDGDYLDLEAISNPPTDVPEFRSMEFEVEPLDLATRATDLRYGAHMEEGGMFLFGDTTVVLNGNGTMNVTNQQAKYDNQNMSLPGNGALFVERGSLTVSGTLNGRLTMGANRDIIVVNNIVYADDPRLIPNSDDILGLIAERDVRISRSAPFDVEIDASIMALGYSFLADSWNDFREPKGRLTVYGSIVQSNRGPVGSIRARAGEAPEENRVSGYAKDYYYDPRPSDPSSLVIPPYYPRTGDYISLSWKE